MDGPLCLFVKFLFFTEKHLLFDSDHCFFIWFVGIELEPHFCLDCQLEAGLPDELLELIPCPLGYRSVVQDNSLQLSLLVLCAVEF